MLRVLLRHARPGMVLSLPIFHPRARDIVLLRAGVELDAQHIAKLRELRIREAWIHYPQFSSIEQYVSPAIHQACHYVTHTISDALENARSNAHARLDYYTYKRAVAQLLEKFAAHPVAALFVQDIGADGEPALRHASTVCLLSLLMGLKLDFYLVRERARLAPYLATDISNLGVGAMLADVGMMHLEHDALRRWNTHADENDPAWRAHVLRGFEMVRDQVEPSAAAVVLHHHQSFAGDGFPKVRRRTDEPLPLAGREIHIFARIAAAADLFARLRHPAHAPGADESKTPSIPIARALKTILSTPLRERIDPVVFMALMTVCPPYPPGTLVRLSNGVEGVVTQWSPDDPCRPTVETLVDFAHTSRAQEHTERFVLRRHRDLFITHADGMDVSNDNFYPSVPGEFDLSRVSRMMANRAEELQQSAKSGSKPGDAGSATNNDEAPDAPKGLPGTPLIEP